MGIVKDVVDALKDVTEAVENIRKLAQAIQDGRDYIKKHHPAVTGDLAALCEEMGKTLDAVARASALITHFAFVVEGDAVGHEPARFNEHLVRHKQQAHAARSLLHSMRGHCSVIKKHAAAMEQAAGKASWLDLLGLDSRLRRAELSDALQRIYDEETLVYRTIERLTRALEAALQDIEAALGPPGAMTPRMVAPAAQLLGEYRAAFQAIETDCNYRAFELRELIEDLTRA